ncbi:exodeoxyribonuclease V subunit gamma [Nocardioides sp. SYSU D00065]|uniref:exodeoxyribonuclease V subunit gamma n=1 Tax=Nocardioides sp. SYSU D00065 TaxID=2817378 RepID=UPI001B337235|nr:exodeoxyribonuclease V subunit gamma [Nocardioides sp. SYSU D00065]
MTLHLHTAERTDALADGLADLLVTPLPDPFAREVVVVPARGVERWLTQRLSHRLGVGDRPADGVCAGVRFVSPRSLVTLVLGVDDTDPWQPDALAWPLLEVIDDVLGAPGFEALTDHLGRGDPDDERSARRYSVAHRLAGLFHRYAVQRPQLVTDWRERRDTDGAGGALADDLRWQAELWRRLEPRVPAPPPDQRHRDTLQRLRSGGDGLDLPPRLSLFGHTRIPRTEAELVGALGEVRDVHLWLPQVSPRSWRALAPTAVEGPVPRAADTSAALVEHPLLASLGRDARELRRTLGPTGAAEAAPLPAATPPPTLLGWLQADLRADRLPTPEERTARVVPRADRSVQVHACHGAARQVDVLREVLVGLLADDPTLEPRDIVVMCPDVESYAPLVSAAFGLGDLTEGRGHPAHELRVRLADRSPGATNPLLALAATLVELAGGRLTATEVLDLAGTEPVRRRFGFDDDGLEQVQRWVHGAAVRWGQDPEHRAAFGLQLGDNTWQSGLRRMLLGAAMSGTGHRFVGGALPLDDVGDAQLELLGRFVEYVDRLERTLDRARGATSAVEWTEALAGGVHSLTATPPDEAWQVAQFDRELARIGASVTDGGAERTVLRHADVRALLAHRLRSRPTRANFRTGTLTVCTMVPMRSVPHRVVCLLGLDDGVFPRLDSIDGDDVLARAPLTGERDVRAEDRQLFLDAIAAAGQTLVITYTGRGEHTGADRPPAVPLGELLDTLDVTATAHDGGRVQDQVRVFHPLQPFDEANLLAGPDRPAGVPHLTLTDEPFTFDHTSLAGALAARDQRAVVRELLPEALPPADQPSAEVAEVALSDVHDFFAHPVRAFLRRRLRVSTPLDADELADAIPIQLDGLQRWDVGDRLIRDVLAGADPAQAMTAEQLRGLLPPRTLGASVLGSIVEQVRPLVTAGLAARRGEPRTVDVDIDLGDRRVTGTVDDLFGNHLVTVGYSRLAAKHRIAGWIDALALATGLPDANWTVHTIGRGRNGGQVSRIGPLPEHEARAWLGRLLDVMAAGLCEPLPLPPKTSLAWAAEHVHEVAGRPNADADRAADREWTAPRFSETAVPTEDADAWHRLAWGERAPFDVLCATPRPGDPGTERHRLGRYAWALWQPLLEHEVVQPL